jgi:diacylglycerol kinase family enzyme
MTSVGVIVHSGKTLGGGPDALRRALAAEGVTDPLWVEVPKSKKAPKRVEQLMDDGVDLLFVWGGDGMVQRCIDTVAEPELPIAIVPAGTANLLATNFGIPQDIAEAVKIGLYGDRRPIDVGRINGERFAVMAGTGLDALPLNHRRPSTSILARSWWSRRCFALVNT